MLAIEDVHWIDEASAEFIRLVLNQCADLPFGLVVTARPEDAGAPAHLDSSVAMEIIELDHLDRAGISDLATQFLGSSASDTLVDLLASRTEGNPLFVREVLRALSDAGALLPSPAGWQLAGESTTEVPPTIEAVLAARIDRLPRAAAEALQGAALIGRDVNLDLLEALLGDTQPALDESLERLVRHGFLAVPHERDRSILQFTHALVLDVAYGRIVRSRRRDLHRRLVDAAIKLYGDGDEVIDLLAHHAYEGWMGAAGLSLVLRAARRAAWLFANAEAITYLEQALAMCTDDAGPPSRSMEILIELGRLLEHTGDYGRATAVYEAAQAKGAGIEAWLGRARALATPGSYDEALTVLDDARASHHDLAPAQLGMIEAERGQELARLGRYAEAREALETAVDLLRTGDPIERADAQVVFARVLESLGLHQEALLQVESAITILEERGELARLTTALRVAGGILGDLDRHDDGITVLGRALELARQVGDAEEEGASLINLGHLYEELDRAEEAFATFAEALPAFERVGIKGGIACAYCNLADALGDLGRFEESEAAASSGLSVAEEIGNKYWVSGALIGLAQASLSRELWDQARNWAKRAIEVSDTAGIPGRGSEARRRLYAAEQRLRVAPTAEQMEEFQATSQVESEASG